MAHAAPAPSMRIALQVHLINPRDSSGTCHADLRAAHAAGARVDVIDLIINSFQG